MANEQNVTSAAPKEAAAEAARTARNESVIRPAVDIFETGEGITLTADMPGVSRERLNLRIDGNTLLVEGDVRLALADGMEALHAEVRSTMYRCSFVLSQELDGGQVEANLKDGVLTVRIPKRAELRPRRIEVRSN
jgi:HSP20 family protein